MQDVGALASHTARREPSIPPEAVRVVLAFPFNQVQLASLTPSGKELHAGSGEGLRQAGAGDQARHGPTVAARLACKRAVTGTGVEA